MTNGIDMKKIKQKYFENKLEDIEKVGKELKEMKESFELELYDERYRRFGLTDNKEGLTLTTLERLEFDCFMRKMLDACFFA